MAREHTYVCRIVDGNEIVFLFSGSTFPTKLERDEAIVKSKLYFIISSKFNSKHAAFGEETK